MTNAAPVLVTEQILQPSARLEDAILYALEGTELTYNVVCRGCAAGARIRDLTGNGIDSPEKLRYILGTPDTPEPRHGCVSGPRTLGKAVTARICTDPEGNITDLTVTQVADRPVVGISWKRDEVGSDYQRFANILERNGALAVFLPRAHTEQEARQQLSGINGVFLTGGGDVEPSLFRQQVVPHGSDECREDRDASDLFIARQAIEMDVPLLAVCRGEQVMNVAMGGGLIQDVPCWLGEKVLAGTIDFRRVTRILSGTAPGLPQGGSCGCEDHNHLRVEVDGLSHTGGMYHSLLSGGESTGILRDSKWLYGLFGDSVPLIATNHHQAVDPADLGRGITVAAVASDGIVEAVEYRDNLFALGLQWHPERDALYNAKEVCISREHSNLPLRALVIHGILHAARNSR